MTRLEVLSHNFRLDTTYHKTVAGAKRSGNSAMRTGRYKWARVLQGFTILAWRDQHSTKWKQPVV